MQAHKAVMNAPPDTAPHDHPALFSEIGRMLDDGLIIATATGEILSANTAAVRFLGEGLVGAQLETVFPMQETAEFIQSRGTERTLSFIPDSSVEMEFKVRIRRMEGGQIMVLVLDMTLQRNLEKVRRDFVANVSHELRSPLTSLAGFIETILMNEIRDWPTQHRFLRIMEEESGRMSRLIDDLLSLSRVEVDEHIIPDARVPLMEVVRTVIASLETRADKNNMRIVLDDRRPHDAPRLVMNGKADEINEVFHNLIENAVKYGYADTDVIISVSQPQDGHVVIGVANTGEQIASRHLNRLTERFYRVDKARSRQIGGTGLGLAIVKHIVNRHRGTMDISSSPQGITRFVVRLPVVAAPVSGDMADDMAGGMPDEVSG